MIRSAKVAFLILLTITFFPMPAIGEELYFIDAHSQMDNKVSESTILQLMESNGVKKTILASRSEKKPGDILNFAASYPDRIIPSMSTKQFGYVSRSGNKQIQSIEKMRQMAKNGKFRAIAETLMWHSGCPDNRCPSVEASIQDKRVKTALKIAIEKGWPFILHIEFGSLTGKKRARFMGELESLLSVHPDHPFALIHMGQLQADEVRQLITKYKNIYFLTAHTNTLAVRSAGGFKPWIDMFDGKTLAGPWRQILVDHPDRFIFAMDNVWSQPHWQRGFYDGQIKLWREALAQLPEDVSHALAHGNAERLWNIPVN